MSTVARAPLLAVCVQSSCRASSHASNLARVGRRVAQGSIVGTACARSCMHGIAVLVSIGVNSFWPKDINDSICTVCVESYTEFGLRDIERLAEGRELQNCCVHVG